MCSVMSAVDWRSDCMSVLIATNSTPRICASTMRLTALTPAPPTPTTRSTGWPAGRAPPHRRGPPAPDDAQHRRAGRSRLAPRARLVGRDAQLGARLVVGLVRRAGEDVVR